MSRVQVLKQYLIFFIDVTIAGIAGAIFAAISQINLAYLAWGLGFLISFSATALYMKLGMEAKTEKKDFNESWLGNNWALRIEEKQS